MTDLSSLRYRQTVPTNRSCGLRAAVQVIAGKWKPLILWHLLGGPVRFARLRRDLVGVTEKVLAEQLDQLEADGIVARRLVSEKPLMVDYRLTPRGETLVPVLAAMSAWGFNHVVGPAELKSPG